MINIVYSNYSKLTKNFNIDFLSNSNKQEENINSDILNHKISRELPNNTNEKDINSKEWCVEIPSINLKANISEGTSKETMDKFVGHFEETSKTNGNIGLAAHNRGYENNYFSYLKKCHL